MLRKPSNRPAPCCAVADQTAGYEPGNFLQNRSRSKYFRKPAPSLIVIFIILSCLAGITGCSGNLLNNTAKSTPRPLPSEGAGGTVETDNTTANLAKPGGNTEVGGAEETLPEVPLPANGYGKFFFKRAKAGSRIKFIPAAGTKSNMIVKLEDWDSGKAICWFFVREGKTVETPIPEGSYRIKIATGQKWYGEERLFGGVASYSSIDSMVRIPARTIYSLSLTPVIDGTLQDKPIDAGDF